MPRKAAGVRGGPRASRREEKARVGALSVISAGTGSRLPGQRSGRGWEAGSPRWLCLSPVLAAAGVGAATAGVGKTAPKAPRSQVCVGGLCCSLGLLGWSAWSGHLTQSFFTHLRAGAGAAELRRVWPRHPAGRALLLLSGKVFLPWRCYLGSLR